MRGTGTGGHVSLRQDYNTMMYVSPNKSGRALQGTNTNRAGTWRQTKEQCVFDYSKQEHKGRQWQEATSN